LEVSTDHSFLANGIFVHNSGPNLQQIPSTGSIYSKPIKKCFSAPKGYLMVGADFTALEAKIGALLTKDPAKLDIYLKGFDSHCYASYHYWPEKMPDIDPTSVESINSIASKYKSLRQASKTVSFAAQYGGSYHTFMNSGFSEEEAKKLEINYHKLYAISDIWIQDKLKQAAKTGTKNQV